MTDALKLINMDAAKVPADKAFLQKQAGPMYYGAALCPHLALHTAQLTAAVAYCCFAIQHCAVRSCFCCGRPSDQGVPCSSLACAPPCLLKICGPVRDVAVLVQHPLPRLQLAGRPSHALHCPLQLGRPPYLTGVGEGVVEGNGVHGKLQILLVGDGIAGQGQLRAVPQQGREVPVELAGCEAILLQPPHLLDRHLHVPLLCSRHCAGMGSHRAVADVLSVTGLHGYQGVSVYTCTMTVRMC